MPLIVPLNVCKFAKENHRVVVELRADGVNNNRAVIKKREISKGLRQETNIEAELEGA